MNKHKYTIHIYLFFLVSSLAGQNSIILNKKIDWYILSERDENQNRDLHYAHFDDASYDHQCGDVPKYSFRIPIPYDSEPILRLSKTRFEALDAKPEHEDCITQKINPYYSISKERNQTYAGINLVPIVRQHGVLKKLVEFEIEIKFKPSNASFLKRGPTFKNKSVLSDGQFYKLAVNQSGIYSLDYSYLVDSMGVNPANLDVSKIQVFSHPAGKLAQSLNESRTDDLEEIPLYVNNDIGNTLDPGEQILFYAPGPHGDNPIELNIYDEQNFLFVRVNYEDGRRMASLDISSPAQYTSQTYDFIQRHESNTINLLGDFVSTPGTGQKWFGEIFTNQRTQAFTSSFDFKDIDFNEQLHFQMSFAGRSQETSKVRLNIQNQIFESTVGTSNTGDVEAIYARTATIRDSISINQTNLDIDIAYPQTGATSQGWLDYLEFSGRKNLIFRDRPIIFRDTRAAGFAIAQFDLGNASDLLKIWDIADVFNTKEHTIKSSSQDSYFRYKPSESDRFIFFDPNESYPNPYFIKEVINQNLHALNSAELIIIYHPDFLEAAERLAKHRNQHDGLNVKIVDVDLIYNEFSSGKQDPTAIRDFAKMIYDRDAQFNYLLLMGDGSYDHRGVVSGQNNESFIPAFETIESLHPLDGFPSDDYYGLLSDNEGATLRGALDIAVGRIPAKTLEEANVVVDKLIKYDTDPATLGDWRNRIAFLADDEDSNRHVNDTEKISIRASDDHKVFNQEKIYFDSFVQESTPGGARYPEANQKFNQEIFKGLLIATYLGHGGPKGWSQERVLKIADINSWENKDKMPLIITATCSFTGYDDPAVLTAGEESILKEDGGAVGLFSTVRAVFASQNFRLTKSVYDTIFTKTDGDYLRIGEILRRSKNNTSADTSNVNARKFLLIGDPSMKLALPKFNVSTSSVNGKPSTQIDTINALEKVEIMGMITDDQGNIQSGFNGLVSTTVFDKPTEQQTLVNDNASRKKTFEVQRNVIFKGKATVTNGVFSFSFVVPLDINYEFGKGKISYYASSDDMTDAAGYFDEFIVGGTDENALADDQGPDIQLFMNDESFAFGGVTDANPILIAKISDDNGINVSGTSIGHDITGVIDQNSQNTLILNEFYSAQVDDFTQGIVRFPLSDLEEGRHEIKVKAFDVANNPGETYTEFIVINDLNSGIDRLLNYPNPFSTHTTFSFEQNLVNTDLDIILDIYTVSGKLVKTIQTNQFAQGYRIDGIDWDGKDDFGKSLGRGIYLYKVKIFNPELNISKESAFQKLVLLN